jgi:hypothetical protein
MATVLRIEPVLKSCLALRSSGQPRSGRRLAMRAVVQPNRPVVVQPRSLLMMCTRTPTARARTTVASTRRPPLEGKPEQVVAAAPASRHPGQLPMRSTVPSGLPEAPAVGPASLNRRRRR